MAINFPNNPSTGNTYDYNGVRYTYQAGGYWAITTPGTVGVASGAEVIAGTDNVKYVTPKAMEDSDYWNARNQGAGSGLDADTLDGLDSTSFARLDTIAPQIFDANLLVGDGVADGLEGGQIDFKAAPESGLSDHSIDIYSPSAGSQYFRVLQRDGSNIPRALEVPRVDGTFWTSGNDGAGSGLDADTLDGTHGNSFLRSDADDVVNAGNTITFPSETDVSASSVSGIKGLEIKQAGTAGDALLTFHISATYATYFGLDRVTSDLFVGGWSGGATKHKIYSEKNCTKSLAENGYQKLASGLIIQWGYTSALVGTTRTITFPIAFPSVCRSVQIQSTLASSNYVHTANTVTNGNFTMQNFGITANYYWMAIGY